MEWKVLYDKNQLEAAIKFLSKYNKHFIGKDEYIRKSIMGHIRKLAYDFPKQWAIGTMGYDIFGSLETEEGIEYEENTLRVTILVNPSVGEDYEEGEIDYSFTREDDNGYQEEDIGQH